MSRLLPIIFLGLVLAGCTSAAQDHTEESGHEGFELVSIARLRDLPLTTGESRFKAVYRITNRTNQNMLHVPHPYFLEWEVQNSADEQVGPTIMFKLGPPSFEDLKIIKPGETKGFIFESLPYRDSQLGFSPRARLRFRWWTFCDIRKDRVPKPMPKGIPFPDRSFGSSWR